MKLTFTKRSGKLDELQITRFDGSIERIQCPKQGMIPHEMVHYAVEAVIQRRGFLTRIGAGDTAAGRMDREAAAEAIEWLVEAMQAETWSGRVPADELIQFYETGCAARGHEVLPVSPAEINEIRTQIESLTQSWDMVSLNGMLVLTLLDSPEH